MTRKTSKISPTSEINMVGLTKHALQFHFVTSFMFSPSVLLDNECDPLPADLVRGEYF